MPLARQSFEEAAKLQAGYFTPVANLAQIDLAEKKPDAARARIEAFLEKDKDNIEAITALASLAQSQGKTADAIALLERASNAKPADIPAALRLGGAYLRTNDKPKATALAQRLLISYPDSGKCWTFPPRPSLPMATRTARSTPTASWPAWCPTRRRVQFPDRHGADGHAEPGRGDRVAEKSRRDEA